MTHYLIVTEVDGERDYELEHPDDCPTETDDAFVIGAIFYTCVEAVHWYHVGRDAFASPEEIPLGRHAIETYYVPGDWYGEQEAGLRLVEATA